MSKTCQECGENKPLKEFRRIAGLMWTHRSRCRACERREFVGRKRELAEAKAIARFERRRARSEARATALRDRGDVRALAYSAGRVSRAKVWERDGGVCHLCGKPCEPDKWHLDHIVPLSRGGEHSYANVAVSHPFCNLSKGARLL